MKRRDWEAVWLNSAALMLVICFLLAALVAGNLVASLIS